MILFHTSNINISIILFHTCNIDISIILLHTCSSFILTVRDLMNFMRLDPGALPFATEYTRITPSVNPINNCRLH